jgi:hypothetical protein
MMDLIGTRGVEITKGTEMTTQTTHTVEIAGREYLLNLTAPARA